MKSRSLFFIAALLSVFASSCLTDEGGLEQQEPLKVSVKAMSTDSRSVLDGNAVKWENGDEIALIFTHPQPKVHVEKFSTTFDSDEPQDYAEFEGKITSGVSSSAGWSDEVVAIYPSSAVVDGKVSFNLPSEQRVLEGGSFDSELNLSSVTVSLEDMEDDGNVSVTFHNAMSIIRAIIPDYAVSLSITGTAPLAGLAPLSLDVDRLAVDADGEWADGGKETTVTLYPASDGTDSSSEVHNNILIWPGRHSALTIKMTDDQGNIYVKQVDKSLDFKASKFYTLKLDLENELIMSVDGVEEVIKTIDTRLENVEAKMEKLNQMVSQIQSVSLMSEYLDNSVHAPYAVLSSTMKMDIELDYLIRPASVAEELVPYVSDVMSAKVYDMKGSDISLTSLPVKSAEVNNGILTVKIDASSLSDSFYNGKASGRLALEISDGNTEILSDFANLVPQPCSYVDMRRTEDIPVLRGATVRIPFKYAVSSDTYTVEAVAKGIDQSKIWLSAYTDSRTGHLSVSIPEDADIPNIEIDIVVKSGGTEYVQPLTFIEEGRFVVSSSGVVDYIGGEVTLKVEENTLGSYMILLNGASWIRETNTGFGGSYTLDPNDGPQRTVTVEYRINTSDPGSYGALQYIKYVTIVQNAYGSELQKDYHKDGAYVKLNNASSGYTPFNIVILGDGYQTRDLQKGGKFEKHAWGAMGTFFDMAPLKDFRDRFDVYMVPYTSVSEGTSVENGTSADTYFNTYIKGGGDTYVNIKGGDYSKVINVVKNTLGLSSDAAYYRTIVILLINTAENVGSNAAVYRASYPDHSVVGEDYASFTLAMIAANSTGTNGLVRHEAAGHAFGRLADEYIKSGTADANTVSNLNNMHQIGWYRNVCTDKSYWNEFIGRSGYENVGYYEGAWNYQYGVYRPTQSSIMLNNNGEFNAPSRRIIYERIIRQSEGYNAYSFDKFLEYDKNNL